MWYIPKFFHFTKIASTQLIEKIIFAMQKKIVPNYRKVCLSRWISINGSSYLDI